MSEPLTKHTGHLVEGLVWTKEKPTVPGWYWARWPHDRGLGAEVLYITQPHGPDTDYLEFDDAPLDEYIAEWRPEWSGPIPLPTDAPAQDWYKAEDVNRITECLHHLLVYVKGIEQPFKDAFESEYRMPSVITDAQTLLDQLRKGRG